jgi:hypothetical protein
VRYDRWTVTAVAVLAYIVANIAHESLGHGAGLLLAGGRSGILTTTRLIIPQQLPSPAWRWFDLGGPTGNLACAGVAWIGLRMTATVRAGLRLLCFLAMAFSLYWAFGYMLFSGVTGRGDWLALLPEGSWAGRGALAVVGLSLYLATNRFAARELSRMLDCSSVTRKEVSRMMNVVWLAGGIIATAGAALDPRGSMEMLNSGALSGLAGAIGLLQISAIIGRYQLSDPQGTGGPFVLERSTGWIVAAAAASLLFIGVLGRGIPWRL